MSRLSRNARAALALIARASQAFTGRETCQQTGGGAITVLVHWRTARVLRERGLVELSYSHRAHAGVDTYRVDAIHLTAAGRSRAATIPEGTPR